MATDKYLNLEGLEEVASKVNSKLRTVLTMPASPEKDDIVLYKGVTTNNYIRGNIYMYEIVETYYKWTDGSVEYYTLAESPEKGDTVYSDTSGTDSGFVIDSFDSVNNKVEIDGNIYNRDEAGDTDILNWVLKNTSIVLNGENKTGNEANFYAPILPGTKGQSLVSDGEGKPPYWSSLAGYAPSIVEDELIFTYGIIPTVDGTSLILDI